LKAPIIIFNIGSRKQTTLFTSVPNTPSTHLFVKHASKFCKLQGLVRTIAREWPRSITKLKHTFAFQSQRKIFCVDFDRCADQEFKVLLKNWMCSFSLLDNDRWRNSMNNWLILQMYFKSKLPWLAAPCSYLYLNLGQKFSR